MKANLKAIVTAALVALSGAVHAEDLAGKTVRVGSDITLPPYNYFNENKEPAGFDADLMGALATAGNFEVEFLDTRFESLILGLGADRFDVIASSMFVKPERAQQVDFIPYANAGLGIAVAAGSDFKPETIEMLCGRRVGLIKGAAYIETIQVACSEGQSADIRQFPTSAEATQALISRNVDAQVDDAAVLKVASDKTGGRIEISSRETLFPVVLGLGVSKEHGEIKSALEAAFQIIKDDGVYQRLLETYNLTAPTEAQFQAAIGQ